MPLNSDYIDWIHKIPSYHQCPSCSKGKLDTRVKRSFIVRNIFVWMDVKRFQCNCCGKKVYIKNQSESHQLDF